MLIRRRARSFRRTRQLLAVLASFATVVSLTQVLTLASASKVARASAVAAVTGTGGEFVALQGRILDTRAATQVGPYSTPMPASTWRTVPVDGVSLGGGASMPPSGVSAVTVTFTAVSPAAAGFLRADKDESTPSSPVSYLNWVAGYAQSNTATVAVGSDGKIAVWASASVDLLVDVQGYYTANTDGVAPGGYVPVTPSRIVDTRNGTGLPQAKLSGGSTTLVPVAGRGGVPAGASAVMANITITDDSSTATHLFTPYPADEANPGTSYSFTNAVSDDKGLQVGLDTTDSNAGDIKVTLSGTGYTVDLLVDVVGYFTAGQTTGAFTPAATRVYDTRTSGHTSVASGSTKAVQVTGVAGVPLAGSGITSVVTDLEVIDGSGTNGYLAEYAHGTTRPYPFSSVGYLGGGVTSNTTTSSLSAGGAVDIYNSGPDAVDFVVDVEGWYTGVGLAINNGQTETQDAVTLQADPSIGGNYVTYQYRVGTTAGFTPVPKANVVGTPTWPDTKSSGAFPARTWHVGATVSGDNLIQVQACYGNSSTDTTPSCGMPSSITFNPSDFSSSTATQDLGPGSLAELTGNYQVSATDGDVASSLGDLSVGRSLSTLSPANQSGAAGVFGPGWTAELSDSTSGEPDMTPVDHASDGYLLFTDAEGDELLYEATSSVSSYPITFTGAGDNAGDGKAVTKASASVINMTDPDGTTTTWTKSGSTWQVTSVQSGSSTSSTDSYSYNASGLVTRILAPAPAGVSCSTPDTTPGCRSLILDYGAPPGLSVTRLLDIKVSIPQAAGTTNEHEVAAYDYDNSGRLADEYDARISPVLKTAYTYTSANRLQTLTPPGQNAYTFNYNTIGQLTAITRPDGNQTATTTIAYGVASSGSSAPVDLSAATTGTWGETSDLPVSGTAIFDPDHVPGSSISSSDWPYASIDYFDVNGRVVNSASDGGGAWQISTSQFDTNGNEIWDLTAGNLDQAQSPTSDTDSYVADQTTVAARAALLTSQTVYNALDPGQVTDTFGPTHPVTLSDGSVIDARTHVATTYDEGAPNSDDHVVTNSDGSTIDLGAYDLPTTVTTTAYRPDTQTDTGWPDESITRTGYDPVNSGDASGWGSGEATSSTVQMGASPSSADLVTTTSYDSYGRTVKQVQPATSSSIGPRTIDTTYYTATGSGSCVDPTRAGLVCSTAPDGQPGTGNPLPVTTYSYNSYGDQTTKTETYGSGSSQVVRTTTTGYDAAERKTSSSISVSPSSAGGTPVPTVSYGYDSSTGLATTTSTTSGGTTTTLTTGYDNDGRTTGYTDANGTNSTTGYDLAGKVTAHFDGKNTVTSTIDGSGTGEYRGLVTSENIGVSGSQSTFTATYDADGDLSTETYPNGLVATRHYDNAGDLTSLIYAKGGSTWMSFTQDFDALGHVAAQTSPESAQAFSYDGDDRLTTVQDTVDGSGGSASCTTRKYSFNADSDRISLASYPAASSGACSVSTTPTTTSYSYDAADRLLSDTAGSYSYDALGRATTIPSGDAQGIGSHSSISGNTGMTYFANDMVASEVQNGTTDSFTLDPDEDRINSTNDSGAITVDHYSGGTDSPAWTSAGSSWSEYDSDMSGNLAALVSSAGTVELMLPDMQGNIDATAADDVSATSIDAYSESTEYGQPRVAASAFTYGWLGTKQRSSADLAGLTLMGARVYSAAIGRFESVDSIANANANAYVYPTDPIDSSDVTGRAPVGRHCFDFGIRCDYYVHRHLIRWLGDKLDAYAYTGGAILGIVIASLCGVGAILCLLAYAFGGGYVLDHIRQASEAHVCLEMRMVFGVPYTLENNNGRYCHN